MYRCVALAALRAGRGAGEVASAVRIELGERVLLDGRDVTAERSARPRSRRPPRAPPRTRPSARRWSPSSAGCSATGPGWVAEGRDIGTVVAPDAEVKVFLTASPQERARRRAAELDGDPGTVLAEQTIRDERDRARAHSPLAPAPGAVVLDTTGLTLAEVVERVVALVRGGAPERV